jgi:hypothetical protein
LNTKKMFTTSLLVQATGCKEFMLRNMKVFKENFEFNLNIFKYFLTISNYFVKFY